MGKPTARELLESTRANILNDRGVRSLSALAVRVEAVLAECEEVQRMATGHGEEHPYIFVERLLRLLNGEAK